MNSENQQAESKCLLCKIHYYENLAQAELNGNQAAFGLALSAPKNRRRIRRANYWREKQNLVYYKILSLANLSSCFPCSDEHKLALADFRKSARFIHHKNYKNKLKLVLNAIDAKARIDQEINKAVQTGNIQALPLLKAEQLEKKLLLAQRSRRLRELTPQNPLDQQLIENFVQNWLQKHE